MERLRQITRMLSNRLLAAGFKAVFYVLFRTMPFSGHAERLLSTWQNAEARSRFDQVIFQRAFNYWLDAVYLKEKDPDKREKLKSICMGGESGKKWAQYYDSMPLDFQSTVGNMAFSEAIPLHRDLEEFCESIKSDAVVIQVGSSSGRELAYLAVKFDKRLIPHRPVPRNLDDRRTKAW